MRVGVVDVGTNSVRVLVAEDQAGSLRDIHRELVITRLGQGVDRDRRLAPEPLRRTASAVAGYVERCRHLGADAIRIIATSAVRDAANRDDFVRAVARATSIEPNVITGEQEAQLGFLGATMGIDIAGPYLVVDIGGGSTELVFGSHEAERFVSLDVGSVRLTERHVTTDPPAPDELDAVAADADATIEQAARVVGDDAATFIGLAGTITTATAIVLNLETYDRDAIHHARLDRDTIERVRGRLASMTSEERRTLPVMPRGREDVIVAGLIVLERIMRRFGFAECLVSESDILDGAATDLLRARQRSS